MLEKDENILDAAEPIKEVVEETVDVEVDVEEVTEAEAEEEIETTIEMDEELALEALGNSLREEIAALEEQEQKLLEKLGEVKRKGMSEIAAKCRELLQRVVRERMARQADLADVEESYREAKARRELAETNAEVDAMAEEIEQEFFETTTDLLEKPSLEPVYDYLSKAKRQTMIGKSIAFGGVIAALLGMTAYLMLVVILVSEFSWISLAVCGAIVVASVVTGAIFGRKAHESRAIAEELKLEAETKIAEYEAEILARERRKAAESAPWNMDIFDATSEVEKMENESDVAFAKAKEEEEAQIAAQNRAILRGVDTVEYLKKNGKKIAAVALTGTAVVAAAAISKSQQKKAKAARKAALIGEIREWLSVFR
jgi:hypothetical protein